MNLKLMWWLFHNDVGWQAKLASIFSQEELDTMDDWENRYQKIVKDHEDYYREQIEPEVKKQVAEFEEEFDQSWRNEKRMVYLDEQTEKESAEVLDAYRYNQELAKRDVPYWFRSFLLEEISGISKDLKRKTFEKRLIMYPQMKSKNNVTPEQIAKAKDFPFDQLIEVDRNNYGLCPFHEGSESRHFWIKNNYGYCFVCNWTGDTLKFVMDTKKISFPEAVKSLL